MILKLKQMAFLSLSPFMKSSLKQISIFNRSISAISDSIGHLNLDCKSHKNQIVSDSDMQCEPDAIAMPIYLPCEEQSIEQSTTYYETSISEFQTEGTTLPETNATSNKSFPNIKGIIDEKSLLAAFCSELSNIWDNSEPTKCQNLPKPIAAPKGKNYFVSNSIFPNEVWSARIENKVSNTDDDKVPYPRCFGYNLPTHSEKISQSVEQTPCKIIAIEPNFIFGQGSVDPGLDSNEKDIFDSAATVCKLSNDGEFKEEFSTVDENFMKFESLEDYTKEMKTVVEDICCMAKRLENSTIFSTVKDDNVYVEPETRTSKNGFEDDSSCEVHELLEQECKEMDYLFLELPPILDCRDPEDILAEALFNLLKLDQPSYGSEMCLLKDEEQTFNLLPVPCSIWCDHKMETHAYASYLHDVCEKFRHRSGKSLFEEHIEEMHSKYSDMVSRNFKTENYSTDLLDSYLWLKDESNTAFATVVPDIEPNKKSEHPNAEEDIDLNPMDSFFRSLYVTEDLLLMDLLFLRKKFKSNYSGQVIVGNSDDCNDSSSQRRSSGYYSDAGIAECETESQSCAEMVNQDKDLDNHQEDSVYDSLYSTWTLLPDLPSSEQSAKSRNAVDPRPSRGKRYTKAPKQYSNTKFGLHKQQSQNFGLSYRQTAMAN